MANGSEDGGTHTPPSQQVKGSRFPVEELIQAKAEIIYGLHTYRPLIEIHLNSMLGRRIREPTKCTHPDPLYGPREYCYGTYKSSATEFMKQVRDLQYWLRSSGVPVEETMIAIDATRTTPVLLVLTESEYLYDTTD